MAAARKGDPATHSVAFRLPTDAKLRLDAMARLFGTTQSQVVADALLALYDSMPIARRRLIDEAIALRQKS